jgi:cellulose biosynthesis protein BcsQ
VKVIALINIKGGVGETTTAVLIDGAPQGSVNRWQTIAGENSFDVKHYPNDYQLFPKGDTDAQEIRDLCNEITKK